MSTGAIIRLVLQSIVFLIWAGLMFRMIFTIKARYTAAGGGPWPSVTGFLRQLRHWMTSPEDRAERNTLVFLTFALLAMSLTSALAAQ